MDDTKFRVGGLTLEEYFKKENDGLRVTRGEMKQLMGLLCSKAAVHEAMKVLEFNLRQSIRTMIEEGAATAKPREKSSLVILP